MTNLLAIAVTIIATHSGELKTNVLETAFNPATPTNRMSVDYISPPASTEKWVTTTVEKIDKLQFDWQGKKQEVAVTTLVSSNTVHLRIKQEWETVK